MKVANENLIQEYPSSYRVYLSGPIDGRHDLSRYFLFIKYGSKEKALAAAIKWRDGELKKPKWAKFYNHTVGKCRLKSPKIYTATGINFTGVDFTDGYRIRNGSVYFCPIFRAQILSKISKSFAIRRYGIDQAFYNAVRARIAYDGRKFNKKECDEILAEWKARPAVKCLIAELELS